MAIPAATAGETLTWSRPQTDAALAEAVELCPPTVRHVCGYHFEWWDESGMLSAQAFGGDAAAAFSAAVAVELVHDVSLLYDDDMDRDLTRRPGAAARTAIGAGQAILAGDALLSLASCCLSASGGALGDNLKRRVIELCNGQSAGLTFEHCGAVSPPECRAMAETETAALGGRACQLSALVGRAHARRADLLGDFARNLSMAFRLIDDLLDIRGDLDVTRKPLLFGSGQQEEVCSRCWHRDFGYYQKRSNSTPSNGKIGPSNRGSSSAAFWSRVSAAEIRHVARVDEQALIAVECVAAQARVGQASDQLRNVAHISTARNH